MAKNGFILKGEKELFAKLNELTGKEFKSVVGTAVRAGAKPWEKEIKQEATKISRSGALARSIATKIKKYNDGLTVAAITGPKSDYEETVTVPETSFLRAFKTGSAERTIRVKPAKYLHLIERGTKPGPRRVGVAGGMVVQHPGTKGKHIMKRSFDKTVGQAEALVKKGLKRGILRIAKRRAKARAR